MHDRDPWPRRLGGITANRIHTEIFGPGPSVTPGLAEGAAPGSLTLPAGPPGAGPLVSFARSGLNIRWDPAFQSLLELAEACDIPVRWACRTGVCHTCETGLVAGRVSYRPDPLDVPAVMGNVLTCCSQPQGDIAIDPATPNLANWGSPKTFRSHYKVVITVGGANPIVRSFS